MADPDPPSQWEALAVADEPGLDELRPVTAGVVRAIKDLADTSDLNVALRHVWESIRSVEGALGSVVRPESDVEAIRMLCRETKAWAERWRVVAGAKRERESTAERFAVRAYLFAQGKGRDLEVLRRVPQRSHKERMLHRRVFEILERRAMVERRDTLIQMYHVALAEIESRPESEEARQSLRSVMLELDRVELGLERRHDASVSKDERTAALHATNELLEEILKRLKPKR